jgi:ABC-2 type transport system ATP-binding protein
MAQRSTLENPLSESAIQVAGLSKVFKVPEREAGLAAALRSLVRRRYRTVRAVGGISFDIAAGEVVGFLGPNGAGKTTTLKMLAGLLYPTEGSVRALGHTPSRRERAYLRRISLIMGNRNQLVWDLPAVDSFELNRAVYQVPRPEFTAIRDELVEVLEIGDVVTKPVRNLSLGERMKVEIAAALVHRPSVLFLDEPTIGLDPTMQRRVRWFVAEYNRRHGATVMMTSHYMADIEALCKRVIVIDSGRTIFDGGLADLVSQLAGYKEVEVTLADAGRDLSRYGEVVRRDGDRVTLRVRRDETSTITAHLLNAYAVADLTVREPPVEDVIANLFSVGHHA